MAEFDWSIAEETSDKIDAAMETFAGPCLIAAQIPGTPYCVTRHTEDLSAEDTVFMAASSLASQVKTVEQRDELVAMFTDTFITLADSTIEALSQTATKDEEEDD